MSQPQTGKELATVERVGETQNAEWLCDETAGTHVADGRKCLIKRDKAAKMASVFSIPPCAIMSIYGAIPFDRSGTARFYCKAGRKNTAGRLASRGRGARAGRTVDHSVPRPKRSFDGSGGSRSEQTSLESILRKSRISAVSAGRRWEALVGCGFSERVPMFRVGFATRTPATPNATPHRTHPPVHEVRESSPSPPGTTWSPSGVHAGEQGQYRRAHESASYNREICWPTQSIANEVP